MEVHALDQRGWTIAAIARHVGRDRKTVQDYLSVKILSFQLLLLAVLLLAP